MASRRQLQGGILVTENGCAVADDDVNVAKNDKFRVEFYQGQKGFLKIAFPNGTRLGFLRSLETAGLR